MASTEKVYYIFNQNNLYNLQASDGKRDEFTNYLEKGGLVESLTDVLMNLYDETEKPKFPTQYIKDNLKSSSEAENEVIIQNNKIKEENRILKQKIMEYERKIERLKKEIEEKQSQA